MDEKKPNPDIIKVLDLYLHELVTPIIPKDKPMSVVIKVLSPETLATLMHMAATLTALHFQEEAHKEKKPSVGGYNILGYFCDGDINSSQTPCQEITPEVMVGSLYCRQQCPFCISVNQKDQSVKCNIRQMKKEHPMLQFDIHGRVITVPPEKLKKADG